MYDKCFMHIFICFFVKLPLFPFIYSKIFEIFYLNCTFLNTLYDKKDGKSMVCGYEALKSG